MQYTHYINSYSDSEAIQAALNEGTLGKPYVALNEDLDEIDWNSLSVVDNRLRVTYNIQDISSPTVISFSGFDYDPETGDPIGYITPYNKVEIEGVGDITADLVYAEVSYYGEVSYQFQATGVYTLLFTLTSNTLWMYEWEDSLEGLFAYRTEITSVVIPENVTELGEGTFWGCSNLTSVNIPAGVTILRTNVFNGCHLSSITFPVGLEEIHGGAFYESLKDWEPGDDKPDVILPESVTSVGSAAFMDCELGDVYIPSGLTFESGYDDPYFTTIYGTLTIENGFPGIPTRGMGGVIGGYPSESVAYVPASLSEIGDMGLTDFHTYHFAGATPPTLGTEALGWDFEEIYAPCEALSAYENAIGTTNPAGNEVTYNCDTPSPER